MTRPKIPVWLKAVIVLAAAAIPVLSAYWLYKAYNSALNTRYSEGYQAGKAATERLQQQAVNAAQADAMKQAGVEMASAAKAGSAQEQRRASVDQRFGQLHEQLAAAHAVIPQGDPHAHCTVDDVVLPAERLRIWREGNSGGASRAAELASSAAVQSAGSASAPAAAGRRADPYPGAQPPASGASVPPAGNTALWPAATPASHTAGLSALDDHAGGT